MGTTNPTPPDPAEVFDTCLRWHVQSRTAEGETYLVDISAYGFNGICQCPDFACRFGPILTQGVTAEEALAAGLVKLRPYHFGDPKNALRCAHVMRARSDFADAMIKALHAAREAQARPHP